MWISDRVVYLHPWPLLWHGVRIGIRQPFQRYIRYIFAFLLSFRMRRYFLFWGVLWLPWRTAFVCFYLFYFLCIRGIWWGRWVVFCRIRMIWSSDEIRYILRYFVSEVCPCGRRWSMIRESWSIALFIEIFAFCLGAWLSHLEFLYDAVIELALVREDITSGVSGLFAILGSCWDIGRVSILHTWVITTLCVWGSIATAERALECRWIASSPEEHILFSQSCVLCLESCILLPELLELCLRALRSTHRESGTWGETEERDKKYDFHRDI